MAEQTPNFNLTKDAGSDYYNIDTVNANLDKIDKALGNTARFETAGGTATAITLTGIELTDGHSKTFIVSANNNGANTTINGKPLYKPGTTSAPKLVAGKAVTVWYNGTHFFIKASAEGDAIADNVLAGKTFSNDDDTSIVGTMTNNGPIEADAIDLSAEGEEYIIPIGFHSGLRKIRAKISGLIASVIKAGTKVGGITGTFTADADAGVGDILSGKTAYKNGSKLTGTMVDRGTVDHSLAINGSFTIPSGKHSGSGKITQNIPTKGAETITPGTANKTIASEQYLSGVQTIKGDANLIPSKIPEDLVLFGVQGTRNLGMRFTTGLATKSPTKIRFVGQDVDLYQYYIEVSGLTFKPSIIVILPKVVYNPPIYATHYVQNVSFPGYFTVLLGTVALYDTKEYRSLSSAYVNSTGFLLPVYDISDYTEVRWIAWECNFLQ